MHIAAIIMCIMKIDELGEFGLIDMIAKLINKEYSSKKNISKNLLLLGIGDDTSAWRTDSSKVELFTTDTMVSDVHFITDGIVWEELGWKALAVNYSDIAAMGGEPLYSVISLGLPHNTNVEDILNLYKGMMSLCRQFGGRVVGGDIVYSPVMFISVAVVGEGIDPPMTRHMAEIGDLVAVTGTLGMSAGGLRMLLNKLTLGTRSSKILRNAHNVPLPKIKQGQILHANGVKVAIDISDGLVSDLSKVCNASEVGGVIYSGNLPVNKTLKKVFPNSWMELALGGGEDYELLFTAPENIIEKVSSKIDISIIGKIVSNKGTTIVDENGEPFYLHSKGWDHFI